MGAREAKSIGLVNAVFADQKTLLDEVMKIATEIAKRAPLAVYGSKRIINYSRDHSTADTLDYISIWNASMLQNTEIREAMAATKENRDGQFVKLPPQKNRGIKEALS
jgi:enoyl-CoA hydratase